MKNQYLRLQHELAAANARFTRCGLRQMIGHAEDRTLPDGQVGAATGRKVAKLSEGSHIEAGDKYEQSRIKWIHTSKIG